MTRMHFESIAAVLAQHKPEKKGIRYDTWKALVESMASMCASSNGGFQRDRFYRACGLEE